MSAANLRRCGPPGSCANTNSFELEGRSSVRARSGGATAGEEAVAQKPAASTAETTKQAAALTGLPRGGRRLSSAEEPFIVCRAKLQGVLSEKQFTKCN